MLDVLKKIVYSKQLMVWYCCAAVGACLFWMAFVVLRALQDQRAPWSLMELWLPLFLSIIPAVALMKLSRSSSPQKMWSKVKEIGLWSSGFLIGGLLVFFWHLQVIEHNVQSQQNYEVAHALSSAHTIDRILQSQSCEDKRDTLLSLANQHGQLTFMDKMWIKDKSLSLHEEKCLSSEDVFEMVRLLKSQHTVVFNYQNASFNWSFLASDRSSQMAQKVLPITRQQWCETSGRQQLKEGGKIPSSELLSQLIMMCAAQPNAQKVLPAPENYAWIQALNTSHLGVSP